MPSGSAPLPSWNDTPTTATILDFVASVTDPDDERFVPERQRVATFDNDGTLWCEKPMPIQLDYVLRLLAAAATADPSLAERQPWKAVVSQDFAWLGGVIDQHYAGNDEQLGMVISAIEATYDGKPVEQYEEEVLEFLRTNSHPTLGRPYLECTYQPMRELLDHLAANAFAVYIVSGGDRDFMRPTANELYGIPRERVIGTTFDLDYIPDADGGGAVLYKGKLNFFDDGPAKPVHIWNRVGRRPILACGNSNGDIQMLEFAGGPSLPALRLLVGHDDADREFDTQKGAETALARAAKDGWSVISIKDDWSTVFADAAAAGATAPNAPA